MSRHQYAPATLLPGNNPGTRYIIGQVGFRTGLRIFKKRKNPLSCAGTRNPDHLVRSLVTINTHYAISGNRGGTVVKVLCYKSEGRWFDSRWRHWNFLLT